MGCFKRRRAEPEAPGEGSEGNCSVSSGPADGSLGSRGGSVRRNGLHGPIGQDALRELLLGLGEAGSCPPVLGVDLKGDGHSAAAALPVRLPTPSAF